jgi:hypothetical protein
MNLLCDQTDCLLHPEYEPPKKEEKVDSKNIVYSTYVPTGANNWNSITTSSSIVWGPSMAQIGLATKAFEVTEDSKDSRMIFNLSEDWKVPLECLFCEYLKKIDMKKEILLRKAKKLLEK